jgi:nucleotide-binding universal stress UspA family protein
LQWQIAEKNQLESQTHLLSLKRKPGVMKTIIFPTDFSKNADKAMLYAVAVAKALQARIIAVNAFDLPYSQNVMSTSLLDIMRETSEKGLKQVAQKLEPTGVEYQTRSMMGNPIRVVKDLAKYYDNCMIVLGTKGASGIEEILIGSNTASILHSVSVPVLAIPITANFKGIKRIVYASDFQSKRNERALNRLATLARALGAEVNILHVQVEEGEVLEPQREKFERILGDIPHSFHIEKAQEKNVEQAILDFGKGHDACMIALMARKHGFIEGIFHSSVTSKVAFHSTCPFLALHEE